MEKEYVKMLLWKSSLKIPICNIFKGDNYLLCTSNNLAIQNILTFNPGINF